MKHQPLKGFRDYLPEEMIPRERMIETVQAVFRLFGFSPLATPAMEYAEVLLGKYGADAEMLIYRFTDQGGRDVALRYDLTVPLARVLASYGDLKKPFKRYQVAPVWRGESPGPGRFREFYQCDVDIVGTDSLLADAECIQVDQAVLEELRVGAFKIRINNRKVLDGLSELLGVAEPNAVKQLYRTIDKLEGRGEATVRELLAKECGLAPGKIDLVFEYLSSEGDDETRLARLDRLFSSSEVGRRGGAELREVRDLAMAGGVAADSVAIDPAIARGLDYYTGTIFETNLLDLPRFGSVMSGGRYDGLIGTFTGQPTPAVGISVGIDRLLAALLELGRVERRTTTTRVLVTVFDVSMRRASLDVARRLREARIETEVFLGDQKVGKQFQYADKKSIPLVVVLGPDEVKAGQATIKDMRKAEQVQVSLNGLVEAITARTGEKKTT